MSKKEEEFLPIEYNANTRRSTRDANWLTKFEQLKAHVAETRHFPDKHCTLSHFCKYTRRKINEGTLEEWKRELFEGLAASRRLDVHTGGRKKKI